MGKQFLCTLTLGVGVVLLSMPSVAEASPASAAKTIWVKGTKIVSKKPPIRITKSPTRVPNYPTHTPRINEIPPGVPIYVAREIERQRREQEKKKSEEKGWFDWLFN